MEVLDTSIASVALPHIAGNLSANLDEATWVLTSYLVANAIVLPASGWFAHASAGAVFCSSASSSSPFPHSLRSRRQPRMIVRARHPRRRRRRASTPLPGHPARKFSPRKRGAAMAVFGLGVVVAPVWVPRWVAMTDQYSWRWAFYINIPIGVLAIFMVSRFVEDPPYIPPRNPAVSTASVSVC